MKLRLLAGAVSLAVFIAVLPGCGRKAVPLTAEESRALGFVYGYLDMSDAPAKLGNYWIRQVEPPHEKPYYRLGVTDGYAWQWVRPAAYRLDKFGGEARSKWKGVDRYEFVFPVQQEGFKVGPGQLHYLGAFKYRHMQKGWGPVDFSEFDLIPLAHPTEREALVQLKAWINDPVWVPLIDQRIAALAR